MNITKDKNRKINSLRVTMIARKAIPSSYFRQIINREIDIINKTFEIQSKLYKSFNLTENTIKDLGVSTERLTLNEIIEIQDKALNILEKRINILEQQLIERAKYESEVVKLYNAILDEEDEDSENFMKTIISSSENSN